jgi:hypothetical protein
MSDEPQGPGWWQASDGAFHLRELHPMTEASSSMEAVFSTVGAPSTDVTQPRVAPIPVPELPRRPTWSGESDRRPEAGPMYPDLFQQAVAGSHLADVVTVKYADGEPRPSLDVLQMSGESFAQDDGEQVLVSASARMPAEVGAFTGASAKKRWRIHR